jgi:hypothetical protein
LQVIIAVSRIYNLRNTVNAAFTGCCLATVSNNVDYFRTMSLPADVSLILIAANFSCLSARLVPTFEDSGCHVVSVTIPYGHILGFLDRSRYFFLSSSS